MAFLTQRPHVTAAKVKGTSTMEDVMSTISNQFKHPERIVSLCNHWRAQPHLLKWKFKAANTGTDAVPAYLVRAMHLIDAILGFGETGVIDPNVTIVARLGLLPEHCTYFQLEGAISLFEEMAWNTGLIPAKKDQVKKCNILDFFLNDWIARDLAAPLRLISPCFSNIVDGRQIVKRRLPELNPAWTKEFVAFAQRNLNAVSVTDGEHLRELANVYWSAIDQNAERLPPECTTSEYLMSVIKEFYAHKKITLSNLLWMENIQSIRDTIEDRAEEYIASKARRVVQPPKPVTNDSTVIVRRKKTDDWRTFASEIKGRS